jgi:hypothetical protein
MKVKRIFLTVEQVEELKRDYAWTSNRELAARFGCSADLVARKGFGLHLKKDRDYLRETARQRVRNGGPAFRKGDVPHNRGKKITEFMSPEAAERFRSCQFRKGHLPGNAKPAGSERRNRDGYIEIKVPGHRRFVFKHRHVWEEHHGTIPKGFIVQFKDGDPGNCEIGNLRMISRAEQMKNENGIYVRYPEDVRELMRLKGVLKRKLKGHLSPPPTSPCGISPLSAGRGEKCGRGEEYGGGKAS